MPLKGNLDKNIRRKIADMQTGEKGFMDIDSLSATQEDNKYRAFLNLGDFFNIIKKDCYKVPIIKIGPNREDYLVDIRKSKGFIYVEDMPFSGIIEDGDGYKVDYVELRCDKIGITNIKNSEMRPRLAGPRGLEEKLEEAIKKENFEEAARLRDQLKVRRKNKVTGS